MNLRKLLTAGVGALALTVATSAVRADILDDIKKKGRWWSAWRSPTSPTSSSRTAK